MEDYYNFLMYELKDIEEEFDNPSTIAHEISLLFSLQNSSIPETFYRLYIGELSTDYSIIYNAIAYFSGCNFLNIECDCSNENKTLCDLYSISESAFFDKGREDMGHSTDQYTSIDNSIQKMRNIIFNDC